MAMARSNVRNENVCAGSTVGRGGDEPSIVWPHCGQVTASDGSFQPQFAQTDVDAT